MGEFSSFDGQIISFREIGQGQPCVLVHGFALDSRQWLPFLAPLATRYRFIMIDLRGHGRSKQSGFAGQDVMKVLSNDIHYLLDFLKIDNAILAGYSLGSAASLAYLECFGFSRISRYLNIDLSPKSANEDGWGFGLNQDICEAINQFRKDCDTLFAKGFTRDHDFIKLPRFFQKSYSSLFHRLMLQLIPYLGIKKVFHRLDRHGLMRYLRRVTPHWSLTVDLVKALHDGYDFRTLVESSPIPIHFFVGQKSEYFHPKGSITMSNLAEVTIFEKSGHGLVYSEPVKFFKCFKEFLEGENETLPAKSSPLECA